MKKRGPKTPHSACYKPGHIPWSTGKKGLTGKGTPNYPKYGAKKWVNSKTKIKSKYKGVCYKQQGNKKPIWVAQICVNYKQIHLGSFPFTKKGELMAAIAYIDAVKKYS